MRRFGKWFILNSLKSETFLPKCEQTTNHTQPNQPVCQVKKRRVFPNGNQNHFAINEVLDYQWNQQQPGYPVYPEYPYPEQQAGQQYMNHPAVPQHYGSVPPNQMLNHPQMQTNPYMEFQNSSQMENVEQIVPTPHSYQQNDPFSNVPTMDTSDLQQHLDIPGGEIHEISTQLFNICGDDNISSLLKQEIDIKTESNS